jgi:hypothetical protein
MRLRPAAAGSGLARSMSQSAPPWSAGAGADGRADVFSSSLIRMTGKLQWQRIPQCAEGPPADGRRKLQLAIA